MLATCTCHLPAERLHVWRAASCGSRGAASTALRTPHATYVTQRGSLLAPGRQAAAARLLVSAAQDPSQHSNPLQPASSASAAAPQRQQHVRHQPPLPIAERKLLRARAETLARERRLERIQVGDRGIHDNFLAAAADMLAKHELLRVKLGSGSDRKEAGALLEEALDCVVVHAVGFTVTLYRQSGLPRPAGVLAAHCSTSGASDAEQQQQQQQEEEEVESTSDSAAGAAMPAVASQGSQPSSGGNAGASRVKLRQGSGRQKQRERGGAAQSKAAPPPEFQVL